jgi:hypothetical protein
VFGGWHLSFAGGAKAAYKKVQSWSHVESLKYPEHHSLEHFKWAIREGRDWDMARKATLITVPTETMPMPRAVWDGDERRNWLKYI